MTQTAYTLAAQAETIRKQIARHRSTLTDAPEETRAALAAWIEPEIAMMTVVVATLDTLARVEAPMPEIEARINCARPAAGHFPFAADALMALEDLRLARLKLAAAGVANG